jgi:hypothetical protein
LTVCAGDSIVLSNSWLQMRVGASLAASPELSVQQKIFQGDLNTGGLPAAVSASKPLTHGHLLDLYHAVKYDKARVPGIGRRLAHLLFLLGYLPVQTKAAEKKWEKKGAKLYEIFCTRQRDNYNQMSAADYLGMVCDDVVQPAVLTDAVSTSCACLARRHTRYTHPYLQAALVAPTAASSVTEATDLSERSASGKPTIVPALSTKVRRPFWLLCRDTLAPLATGVAWLLSDLQLCDAPGAR